MVQRKVDAMALSEQKIFQYANKLDAAVVARQEVRRLTLDDPDLTLRDAYQIQGAGIRLRESRGERIVGYKMGLTSRAKMEQMGVKAPISGVLTSAMQIASGSSVSFADRIHPKVEPEIAFVTARELRGSLGREEFLANCSRIAPALEVIDSRFLNFDFTLNDVVADNCSAAAFAIGDGIPIPHELDLTSLAIELWLNDKKVQSGFGNAILGHPVDSALALLAWLGEQGLALPAHSIVLAGGATVAEAVQPGDRVECRVERLGAVHFTIGAA